MTTRYPGLAHYKTLVAEIKRICVVSLLDGRAEQYCARDVCLNTFPPEPGRRYCTPYCKRHKHSELAAYVTIRQHQIFRTTMRAAE